MTNLQKLSESEWIVDKAKGFLHQGKLELAENQFSDAILTRKQAVGDVADAGVADLLDQLGEVKMELNKYQEAHECFDSAITIYEKLYYPLHFKLGPVLSHKATCFIREGKWEQALDLCLKAVDIFSKTLSGEHRLTLEATYKLCTIYRHLKKPDEAIKLIAKTKKNVDTPLGPMEEFSFLEGLLNEDEGKADLADKAYLEAINGFRKRRNLKRLADCLARYSEFLKKQNRNEEATKAATEADFLKITSAQISRSDDLFPSTLLRA